MDRLVRASDVARYILRRAGPMTTLKLQKLVYYAQAWSLAWDGVPLFSDPIEAWEHGPVVRSLFESHRGRRWIRRIEGSEAALSPDQQDTVDAVLERYGLLTAEVLSELTHAETPWRAARQNGDTATVEWEALRTYYQTVLADVLVEARDDPTLATEAPRFWLKSLLSQVTPDTVHEEWDTGQPQGREVW